MWLRIVAWILPAVVILQSVSDHATYIARIAQQLGQSDSGGGSRRCSCSCGRSTAEA